MKVAQNSHICDQLCSWLFSRELWEALCKENSALIIIQSCMLSILLNAVLWLLFVGKISVYNDRAVTDFYHKKTVACLSISRKMNKCGMIKIRYERSSRKEEYIYKYVKIEEKAIIMVIIYIIIGRSCLYWKIYY